MPPPEPEAVPWLAAGLHFLQHRWQPAEDTAVLGLLASRVALPAFVPFPASRQGNQLAASCTETMAVIV